ncbi:hypothetical protein AMTR_s00003p00138410 [Amborella trichopoda]|uniref:Uncharacterized protein n=1 Tax=Amborella trichopoda TaxID=13333 RepID=W1P6B5_AMBTC|nr:hypothetical protein AMTR_s00003p00138410 [Amborella trichopoda]
MIYLRSGTLTKGSGTSVSRSGSCGLVCLHAASTFHTQLGTLAYVSFAVRQSHDGLQQVKSSLASGSLGQTLF